MKIAIKNNSFIKIYNGEINYTALTLFIKKEFQISPSRYTLTYVDEDGDNITLASNEDMLSAHELNSDKNLLKVKLNIIEATGEATGEDDKIEIELINEAPAVEEEIKQEPKKVEEPQKEEAHEQRRHHWGHWGHRGFWGRHGSHHESPSETSHEGHHGHGRFRMFHEMMNTAIAEKVDERVKALIPCLKAQL